MTTATIRANRLLFSKANELFYSGVNVWAPFGRFSNGELLSALNSCGGDLVIAEYRTTADPKHKSTDRRKCDKRIQSLSPDWVRGPWRNRVIDGHVLENIFECELSRQSIGDE